MLLKNKKIVETLEPGVVGHNHPVDHVTWDDAVDFCIRLSEMPEEKASGHAYRLPTEAGWEYACRAGTTSAYSLGDSKDSLDQAGWYGYNAGSEPIDSSKLLVESEGKLKKYVDDLIANGNTPHPVGRKKPNAWGLYDMHGNLWEWCSDWHGDYIDRYVQ
jgi:formylglycine-generating enzyme required for sulfatase activity